MRHDINLQELAIDRGSAAPSPRGARRHLLTRYVLPALLILGFLSLVGWASRDLVFPPKRVTVVPVFSTTAEVRREGTPLFNAAGWIEPRPTPIRVAALAPGVVEKLLVVEDQRVSAGDPIAELVRDDAQLAHDSASADLSLREAELAEATAAYKAAETRFRQPVHLEAALGEAEAALAKINTALKNLPFETRRAEADFAAMTQDHEGKLAAQGVVSGVEIDIAKSKMEVARALVEELRDRADSLVKERTALTQRRDALQTQLELLADETREKDAALAKIAAARARVVQAEVRLAEARLRLDRMTISAPVTGRIFRLIADPGTRLGSGMTQMQGHDGSTVVTMYRPDKLQVRVDVRFEDVPKVSLGQPVEIDNPALPAPLTGEVLYISSEADIQKNTLQVKVAISDPPPVVRPEMLVDVTFQAPRLAEQQRAPTQEVRLYIPEDLLQRENGETLVWLADQSAGVAVRKPVAVGDAAPPGLVEITGGLTVTSRLIAQGRERLENGDRIHITGEDNTRTR